LIYELNITYKKNTNKESKSKTYTKSAPPIRLSKTKYITKTKEASKYDNVFFSINLGTKKIIAPKNTVRKTFITYSIHNNYNNKQDKIIERYKLLPVKL
jgi:hypothetical protein